MAGYRGFLLLGALGACDNGMIDDAGKVLCGPGTENIDDVCLPVDDGQADDDDDAGSANDDVDGTEDADSGGESGAINADDDGDAPSDDDAADEDVVDGGGVDGESPADTGMWVADTGEAPTVSGCDSPSLAEATIPVGFFDVGEFMVQLDDDGELYALHTDDFSHAVFHSASERWFAMGNHELHAEEHQGSFDINVREVFTCTFPRFTKARVGEGAVEFSGSFEDGDPRCADATFSLRICEESENRLAFTLRPVSDTGMNYSEIRLRSHAGERFYGMGEQFPHDTLNLKGREIGVISEEGGVGRGHPIISAAVDLASPGSAGNEGTTYYAAPHYITSDLHSVFLKNTAYAVFDFEEDEHTEIRLHDGTMSWEAIYAEQPLELIERFTEYAGRMPPPPDWTQSGAIVALARPLNDSLALVEGLIEAGTQVAGVWNQTWSGINETYIGEQVLWNWVLDEEEHPGWHDWVSDLADMDVRTLCYVNSMFLDLSAREAIPGRHLFQEGNDAGYFVKDEHGDTLMLPVTAFDVALLDFTNEDARAWMKDVIVEEMVDHAGCSGWMVDFAEALPFEAELHDGSSAAAYHNQYPVEWMKLNREALEEAGLVGEILTFNRSGHTQSPGESLMFWQGDQLTTWDNYDGMGSAVRGLINGGFSGLALNHSDTGGYTSLSRFRLGYTREAELLKRWGEFSAFTSMLRTHEGNQPESNAQVYDDDQMEHFAWVSRVFAGLQDYRSLRFAEAEEKGWPVVRHMWLHYPTDGAAHESDDQFLLGSGFLVAPVLEKCEGWFACDSERDVYLPEGRWTHLWTGELYVGPMSLRIASPMQQPPVFYLEDDPEALEAVASLRALDVGVHEE